MDRLQLYCGHIVSQNISWRCRQSNTAPVIVWGIARGEQFRTDCHINDKTLDNPLPVQCQCSIWTVPQSINALYNPFYFFLLLLPSQWNWNCLVSLLSQLNYSEELSAICVMCVNRSNIQSSVLLELYKTSVFHRIRNVPFQKLGPLRHKPIVAQYN